MKKVKIQANQVGIVSRNGVYERTLTEGSYWMRFSEEVAVYEQAHPFTPPFELNLMLRDEQLKELLHVVDVPEGMIAIVYKNGFLVQVLPAGRYTFWKGVHDYDFRLEDISNIDLPADINRTTLAHPHLQPYVRSVFVEGHERALLFVDGRYTRMLEGGMYFYWKNAAAIQLLRADMRMQQVEMNGQEILTRDKAMLRINAWAQYRVVDAEKALRDNKEYDRQLYVTFQVALREYAGSYTVDELLEKKDAAGDYVLSVVAEKAAALGVEVSGFGVRDIILPGDVKDIMNQVLIAEKKAQANIITRREETAGMRSMLNTAKLMEENQMLFKLKEMEYIEKIAEKISNISVNGNGMLIDQLKQIFVKS